MHRSIFDYLPVHQEFNTGARSNITVEHLLTMSSGLEWDEWNAPHGTADNDIDRLYLECSDDPLRCVLERPVVAEPGTRFTYNGGGILALGEIIQHATGRNILDFSREYLLAPLGIDTICWSTYPGGQYEAGSGILMRPRDMMKFGVTYLHNGIVLLWERWVDVIAYPKYTAFSICEKPPEMPNFASPDQDF